MKNQSSIAIGKVAAALLANLEAHGFTPSLTYRARLHRLNNQEIGVAVGQMRATLVMAETGFDPVDVSDLRLRVLATGRRASKSEMNWQVDDLINFLQGWVRAGQLTQERAEEEVAKVEEWAYFRHLPASCLRRVNMSGGDSDKTQILVDGQWEESGFTLGDLRKVVSLGQAEWVEAPQLKMTKPESKVTYCHGASGSMYRITPGKERADILIDGHIWRESPTGAGYLLSEIANGRAIERPEPELVKPEPSPESALSLLNGPAQPSGEFKEATDPVTGHTYKVGSDGRIWVRQAGNSSFCAGNCNVNVVRAVVRLGLIDEE